MKWYVAKIVYRIISGSGLHKPQFDEHLRLIIANEYTEAFEKAIQIGKAEEETFINHKDQLVQWKFIDVSDLYQLNELTDGAELYSSVYEADDGESYINFVHQKAQLIRESNQLLNLI